MEKVESLSAELPDTSSLRLYLLRCDFPKKLVSDAGMNFVSEQFKGFCRYLNIDQEVTLITPSTEQWSRLEACIKLCQMNP